MASWSQNDLIDNNKNFNKNPVLLDNYSLSTEDQINICTNLLKLNNNLLEEINRLYNTNPTKELGDARIHLAMSKNCLDKINKN